MNVLWSYVREIRVDNHCCVVTFGLFLMVSFWGCWHPIAAQAMALRNGRSNAPRQGADCQVHVSLKHYNKNRLDNH